MGVGGHFWDLFKPYAKTEGFDFLRNKRVAVDLSFWIVQHETAIKGYTRNRHLRLTFFRTINLFAKFGAFPIFVVDGTPSPLKSHARRLRFYRASGMDTSSLPEVEERVSIERNGAFLKCVRECVELLEVLGMPVLRSSGEAEALCAQLNREGCVDACITSDSDAFLFGAKCVIKSLRPSSKDPFECYYVADIEAGLGLTRKHLIAISLLVGNDHDLNGVPGIGLDTALRFVKHFSEDVVLNRLHEISQGEPVQVNNNSSGGISPCSEKISAKPKVPHCSHCGHPGSKKVHLKSTCQNCFSVAGAGCIQKPLDFTCNCSTCDLDRKAKEQQKNENWWIRLRKKIASEPNFPNAEILEIYLKDNHRIDDGHQVSWRNPKTEMLIDFLAFTLNWEPSYVRQRMLPMLSTIFLRDIVLEKSTNNLLYGQYEFHSIQRVKVRWGHQLYVVKWKKAAKSVVDSVITILEEPEDVGESEKSADSLDEPDVPQIQIEDGVWFLLTDEDMELVRNAFPEKVNEFQKEKELKEMKSRRKKSGSVSPSPRSLQLSIKEFYCSSKVLSNSNVKIQNDNEAKSSEKSQDSSSESKRKQKSPNFSKSARRKLVFG